MKKVLIFLIVCIIFAGCSNAQRYANLSSGVIGCLPDEMNIEHETIITISGMHNWEAVCKGKRYICSYKSTTGVNCAEMFIPFVPGEHTSDYR